ncbi:HDOD domain-containing protein, partial [Candidatus Latescibacterota bacterium]
IIVTDNKADQNILKAVQLGADNIIFKPIEVEKLPLEIAYTIERQKINFQNREYVKDLERNVENFTKEFSQFNEIQEQNFVDTIKIFVGLLESRNKNLGSHSKRVATFSRALSDQYDLKERVKRDIEIGALLHDIGKMCIPDNILLKTQNYFSKDQLTIKELNIYQKHPLIGYEAVEMVNLLSNVGDYIKYHHERFDGSGYPEGLTGFYIPLGARIISVVDVYEKIVFSVEKRKQGETEILFLKYLQKHRGKIFDPEAVDIMVKYLKEIKSKKYSSERRISISDLTPGMILARDLYSKSGVLVISQYERVTGNDIERINRFLISDMIIDSIYIYESSQATRLAHRGKVLKIDTSSTKTDKGNITFENVCETIDSIKDIQTLPEVYNSFIKFMSDEKITRDDLPNILKRDPITALKILRIANTPLFSLSHKVTTVEEAISLLGYNETRKIATSVSVLQESNYETDVFNRKAFWIHMIGCASISKIIAKHIGTELTEEYYIAGLFHDVGKLIFDQFYPKEFRKLIQFVDQQSIFYRKGERLVFGQNHMEVGEYFLNKWNIPDVIKDAVKYHHSPMDSKIDPVLASAVHLSDLVAHMLHIGESGEKTVPKYMGFAEKKLGILISDLETLLPEIDEEVKQSQEILFR